MSDPTSGPPAVLLPGLLETHHMWETMIDRLRWSPDRMAVFDLPGHMPGDDAETIAQDLETGGWIDRLAEQIRDRFGGVPALLIGHSTGGMMALWLAQRYPELIDSLVLIGALTKGDRGRTFDPGARFFSVPMLGEMAFRAGMTMWLSSPEKFQQGYALAAADRKLEVPAPEAMRAQLSACDPSALYATAMWVLNADVGAGLAQVGCPVLAIIGSRDPIVPPAHQIGIIRGAPQGVAQMMPAGHLPFAECPDLVVAALRGWQLRQARG